AAAGLLVLQGPNTDLPPVVLQHVGARWYDAGVGRFMQRDPIGVGGGLNVYVYCWNGPLSGVDPSGLINGPDRGGMMGWDRRPKRDDDVWGGWWRLIYRLTGGNRHIPVIDLGPSHDAVVLGADIVSLAAPGGACVRVVTMGGKGVRAAQKGWWIERRLLRLRRYIRLDPPHHGRPWHWDGKLFGGR
ncbi:hypothetical protein GF395_04285, partial [Candidatus Uhrbacteria bacterium]|nr:hypothetical protein [Candidatus Uhrbacteria bacterium]